MIRTLLSPVLFVALLVLTTGQVRSDDVVTYFKKAAKTEVTGKIEKEGPEGLRLKTAKMAIEISAMDVLQVVYEQKRLTVANFRPPFSSLEKCWFHRASTPRSWPRP